MALVLLGPVAGCKVGPNYLRPFVAEPAAYKEAPPQPDQDAGIWKRARPADRAPRAKWWEAFGDPQLDALEDQVTAANQDLKAAEANFRQARALIGYSRAAEFPTVSVAPEIDSLRWSNNRPYFSDTKTTGDFILPFDLSYEVDLWGKIDRTVTAAGEEAQATAADLGTVSLSLHAELMLDYFDLRSADSQQQLLDDTVKAFAEALQLTKNRAAGGAAPESDVAEAQTQLDTTRVLATDIGVQRAQYEHAIAVLIGKPPASFGLKPAPLTLRQPAIPVGLPSELLQRRPDIAAAERRVAEANERIGIAIAAYYPSLDLNPSIGFEGSSLATWFGWPSLFWAVGGTLTQTLFDGGQRHAATAAARASYDATVANYRQTTLRAFQDVGDNLAALRILEEEARQQAQAVASAKNALRLFTNRYVGGRDTYLQVITAQTTTLANERNETDILRRRMEASVRLVKALGGGWDVSNLPKIDDLKKTDNRNTPN
ncbi:MAG TPA: efflux transporter outer membrane subunit [Stellaceae bacterium]|nr:efflux transporter outer membrane subunit [Stellaceae bacterium]